MNVEKRLHLRRYELSLNFELNSIYHYVSRRNMYDLNLIPELIVTVFPEEIYEVNLNFELNSTRL